MKNVFAFVLSCISAYALSLSADCLFGTMAGVYADTRWPMFTWGVIALVTGSFALILASGRRLLVIPFAFFALFAAYGGIVGHRYNFAVAGVLLLASIVMWGLTAPKRAAPDRA